MICLIISSLLFLENFELAKKVEQLTEESRNEIHRVGEYCLRITLLFTFLIAYLSDDKVKYLDMEQKITKKNLKTVRKKSRTSKPIF